VPTNRLPRVALAVAVVVAVASTMAGCRDEIGDPPNPATTSPASDKSPGGSGNPTGDGGNQPPPPQPQDGPVSPR
jgi:hypothetical protein